MDVNDGISFNYPDMYKKFHQRIDELECVRRVMDQLAKEDYFKNAETLLSFGAGFGLSEIEFINRCLPNLKKLIAVEGDPNCVKDLKVNLKKAFGDKLQLEIREMSFKDFMENENNWKHIKEVDIVTCFHCLYYMSYSDRMTFYKLCFDHWLKAKTGVLAFNLDSMEDSIAKINEALQPYVEPLLCSEKVKDEMKMLKIIIAQDIRYGDHMDLREYDRDLSDILKFTFKTQVTDEMVEKAMKAVAPDGVGKCRRDFVVARNEKFI